MSEENEEIKTQIAVIRKEELNLLNLMREKYPKGSQVTVTHPRGQFSGFVEGHDTYSKSVVVFNPRTEKSKCWHYTYLTMEIPSRQN